MSRRQTTFATAALLALAAPATSAKAQDGATGFPPERIDLTVTAPPLRSTEEECRRQREAAMVSGEIVVCGALPGEEQRITSREEARNRYAARTQGASTPDVAGPGIFRGPATLSGICVPGIFNCPRPPALMVDVTGLPKAPPGSDADRIARGLAPLGEDAATAPGARNPRQRGELGPLSPNPAELAAPGVPR